MDDASLVTAIIKIIVGVLTTCFGVLVLFSTKKLFGWLIACASARREALQKGIEAYKICNEMHSTLDSIYKELKPNGGESLRDAIDRVERHGLVSDYICMSMTNMRGVGVFVADKDGGLVSSNKILRHITGRSHKEMKGFRWKGYIHDDDFDSVVAAWQAAVDESFEFQKTYRYNRPDGTSVKVTCISNAITNSSGQTVAFVGLVRPVDDYDFPKEMGADTQTG